MPGTQTPEDGVTPDTLGLSIDELVAAADASALVKGGTVDGNRIESSGRVDGEDARTAKVTGGGRAPVPKALDSMMIGKLADMGFDVGQIAAMEGALTGKAAAASEEEEDDSMDGYMGKAGAHAKGYADKNGGSMKGYMGYHPGVPGMGKSGAVDGAEPLAKAMESYQADPEIGPMLDGTDFLAGFVEKTAGHLDAVNETMAKGFGNQRMVNQAMAGAIHQTGTLIKGQAAIISEMGRRLGLVEAQPLPVRGVTTASAASALAKSMPHEAGDGREPLKKHEILSTLSYMNLEKGMREIAGERTAQIIGLLEGGNQCSEQALSAVNDFLTANPTEVDAARTYQ